MHCKIWRLRAKVFLFVLFLFFWLIMWLLEYFKTLYSWFSESLSHGAQASSSHSQIASHLKTTPKLSYKEREEQRRLLKKKKKQLQCSSIKPKLDSYTLPEVKKNQTSLLSPLSLILHDKNVDILTDRQPQCVDNYIFSTCIAELHENIKQLNQRLSLDAYLFGSANYKVLPNDLDILIPNIKTCKDKKKVRKLIHLMESQCGAVLVRDRFTGAAGYKTGNRFVIPIAWNGIKIDFIISSEGYAEHAKQLDFTVGAMYFDLLHKKMHHFSKYKTLVALDRRKLDTVIDPVLSFERDPSRILRAVRLIANEGFSFSPRCYDALHILFSGGRNAFESMNIDKFYQQLSYLCTPQHRERNIECLIQLNLFLPLFTWLHKQVGPKREYYMAQFEPYAFQLGLLSPIQLLYQAPYHSGFFTFSPISEGHSAPLSPAGMFSSSINSPT